VTFSSLVPTNTGNILQKLDAMRLELIEQGVDVINLSAGTPDLQPPQSVMDAIAKASSDPENYKYSLMDLPELHDSVITWYDKRYGVSLNTNQVIAVHGSQDGMATIFHALVEPGDTVLVGTPTYPIFSYGPKLARARVITIPLVESNDYLIDFDAIDTHVAQAAKVIVVSYPCNPIGAVAPREWYEKLIAWAKQYDVIVIHDNAYSEYVHDGEPGGSFLSVPGALDVGIEFNSLSKSYNLTGIRISFALGNEQIIDAYKKLRSEIDYGLSFIDQVGAIAALADVDGTVEKNRIAYKERRDAFCDALNELGWQVDYTPATMFTWFKLPEAYANDSEGFVIELLKRTGVICVPGSSFGEGGEGYVRFALVCEVDVLLEAARRIAQSGLI
jgi:LL-diaminopimelate aminotransferase